MQYSVYILSMFPNELLNSQDYILKLQGSLCVWILSLRFLWRKIINEDISCMGISSLKYHNHTLLEFCRWIGESSWKRSDLKYPSGVINAVRPLLLGWNFLHQIPRRDQIQNRLMVQRILQQSPFIMGTIPASLDCNFIKCCKSWTMCNLPFFSKLQTSHER